MYENSVNMRIVMNSKISNVTDLKPLISALIGLIDINLVNDDIKIETDDNNFDKDSFKKIIFDSISEFQEKTKLIDITTSQNQDKIKELFIRDDSK